MTDVSSITDEQRKAIASRLNEFAVEERIVEEAAAPIRAQLAPFIKETERIDDARTEYLAGLGVDIAGTCQRCGRLLFEGDKGGRPYIDERDAVYCWEHAMTYGDLRAGWQDRDPDDDEYAENRAAALELVEAHVASGGNLFDPILETL